MAEYATKADIEQIVEKAVADLSEVIASFAQQVDTRFNVIESRLDDHDDEFRKLNTKYDHLLNTIDGFLARIDKYEIELAARDNQFQKLLAWARKVSEKTGIPLENL